MVDLAANDGQRTDLARVLPSYAASFSPTLGSAFQLGPSYEVKAPALVHDETHASDCSANHAKNEPAYGRQRSALDGIDLPNG